MQHRLVIFNFFLPANEYTTEAVYPAMSFFHNPMMSLKIAVFDRFRLFFSRLDMRFTAIAFQIRFQPFCFVVFIIQRRILLFGPPDCGALRIGNQLYALLPSACFFVPAGGDLVMPPSIDNNDQSIASSFSLTSNPFCQNRSETTMG